ncbi:unnamed protein product [Prorocentrum cordatum]|uniref:Secreted protein n=1 Tax=Prorocentrum cordatum TaxID=2364126 RepID=A0ABN9VJQ0_9DINO|nr:unnamed protein product [Polarella glacialis]
MPLQRHTSRRSWCRWAALVALTVAWCRCCDVSTARVDLLQILRSRSGGTAEPDGQTVNRLLGEAVKLREEVAKRIDSHSLDVWKLNQKLEFLNVFFPCSALAQIFLFCILVAEIHKISQLQAQNERLARAVRSRTSSAPPPLADRPR